MNSTPEKFENWIVREENKAAGTAYSYTRAVVEISKHYSEHTGSNINLFDINDVPELDRIIGLYDVGGKYEHVGMKGNRTYVNGLKTLDRFLRNSPKRRSQNDFSPRKKRIANMELDRTGFNQSFEQSIINEADLMMECYKSFYCLERSIRQMIKTEMIEAYGENWWDKVDFYVRENVSKNINYELDTAHTKRSDHNIDYTTFGGLRKIINSNWDVFQSKFSRNLTSVNEVMIDLNRLRVPIAHCTPLAYKELKRLAIRMDDWFDLLRTN